MTTDQQQPDSGERCQYASRHLDGPCSYCERDALRAQLADMQTKEASMLEHQRYVGGIYADLAKAHEAQSAQLVDMQQQLGNARASFEDIFVENAELHAQAERDLAKLDALRAECADWEERYGDLLDDATGLRVLADRYQEHREAAEREVERLKPVLEAAKAVVDCMDIDEPEPWDRVDSHANAVGGCLAMLRDTVVALDTQGPTIRPE